MMRVVERVKTALASVFAAKNPIGTAEVCASGHTTAMHTRSDISILSIRIANKWETVFFARTFAKVSIDIPALMACTDGSAAIFAEVAVMVIIA